VDLVDFVVPHACFAVRLVDQDTCVFEMRGNMFTESSVVAPLMRDFVVKAGDLQIMWPVYIANTPVFLIIHPT
jgi:hypothetical protein